MSQAPDTAIRLPREAWPAINELPAGDMRMLAEEIGMEKLMRLYELFRSTTIYFGGFDRFLRGHRDTMIRREFDRRTAAGRSARQVVNELAREYGLSDRWVWEIIGRPDDRQMRMWG
jgi:Mor family transcriptional regulator